MFHLLSNTNYLYCSLDIYLFSSCHRQLNPLVSSGAIILGNLFPVGQKEEIELKELHYNESPFIHLVWLFLVVFFLTKLKTMLAMHLNIKLQSFSLQSLLNIKYSPNGSLQGNKCLYLVHKWKSSKLRVCMESMTEENPWRLKENMEGFYCWIYVHSYLSSKFL